MKLEELLRAVASAELEAEVVVEMLDGDHLAINSARVDATGQIIVRAPALLAERPHTTQARLYSFITKRGENDEPQ
jgi:hypothetical protein